MNISSALINKIIVEQDMETWGALESHYLPTEYQPIFRAVETHFSTFKSLPTFDDLKLSLRDQSIKEKIFAIETLDVDSEAPHLLEYLKNEYTHGEILNKLDKEKNWNELGSFLKQIDTKEIRNIIGVGGNAKLIIQAANSVNDYLSFEELKETKITLENTSTKEMVTEMNFPEDRADIIEHAAAIFEFIQRRFVKANFYASNWSISDGFMQMKKNLHQATSLESS